MLSDLDGIYIWNGHTIILIYLLLNQEKENISFNMNIKEKFIFSECGIFLYS